MKTIPKDFISDLIAKANIVDIVSQKVPLKRRGDNHWGNCPFHDEKTPSFSVNEKKQMYHCFGCGVGGSVINFLMEYDRLSYPEAIEELAHFYNITVPYVTTNQQNDSKTHQNNRRSLFSLMDKITQFYQHQLTLPHAKIAKDYLQKRGLNQDVITRYRIGYSPDEWSATLNQFANNKTLLSLYDMAGMLSSNDKGNQYDRFRGRIMFPICDKQGNVIAFGGRTLKESDTAKYLNSPETTIFHKSYQLYGLYELLQINRSPQQLLVVEGYMDVVALAQFDINYAVATLGTAITPHHMTQLFRVTNTVIFCFDGDDAGRRAALRALNVLLPVLTDDKQIKFVFLPEGEDPDSLVRKEGKPAFEHRLNCGLALSAFLFEHLLSEVDLTNAEGKAKLSALAAPLISQVKAQSFAMSLKRQLGDYLGYLDLSQVDALINQNNQAKPKKFKPSSHTNNRLKITHMRILIGLLVQRPELAKKVPDIESLKLINKAGMSLFIELLTLCNQNPNMMTAQILAHYQDSSALKQLTALASWDHQYPDDKITSIFTHTLKALYDSILAQRRDELIAKDRTAKLTIEEKHVLASLLLVLSKKD